MSASCTECRTLLGGYVLHALEPDEEAVVRGHLAACEACAIEHQQLAGIPLVLDAAGASESPVEQPPPALEEAVLDRFAREHSRAPEPTAAAGANRASWRHRLRRPLPAALAGAVAAAAVTAALIVLPGGQGQGRGEGEGEWYQASLSGARGATASADLRVQSSGTHVRLRVKNLRGTPGAVYELWCLRDDGNKVSAGTFRTDGSGRADVSLTTAAVPGEYHKLSIERKAFTPAGAVGERVMAGEIEFPHS